MAEQGGNRVWEMVCQTISPIGSHVAVTGTLVQDVNHPPGWNQIHPVSRMVVVP